METSNKFREKELLDDLRKLVAIPSVRDLSSAKNNAPFGKEIRNVFDEFIEIAKREGFQIHDENGYAVTAQIGNGEDYIAVLGHLDVVEAGDYELWDQDPFTMTEKDGILYGRGVNDDKGPLLAALYAVSKIKEENIKLRYPIRIIAGGAEETTWECMKEYFKHNKQPIYGFSPDGNFPIVNGEKGILQVRFSLPKDKGIEVKSKTRLNYVCDDLEIILPNKSDISFIDNSNEIRQDEDGVHVSYKGVRSLSRNPQRGENAIFKFVKDFREKLQQYNSLNNVIHMISDQFLDDFYGKKSGLYYEDDEMGVGSICLMSLSTNEEELELCVDVRYVKSANEEELLNKLQSIADQYGCKLDVINHKRLLYVPEDSDLIKSLKIAYKRVMNEDADVFTKGGASYARVLDKGVAFGATFPNEDPHPHMPNECMPITSLMKAAEIYYEALKELACWK
ncbi:MAG: Sapep family Mn(2+)-dependent dipeptidase [Clostridium sp.]